MEWTELNIENSIIKTLQSEKIEKPTRIQEKVYPAILSKKDIIVQSETGSGKTLAYLLPLYTIYKECEKTNKIIVLTPTHELAIQVHKQIEHISKTSNTKLQSAVLIGDVNIKRQIERLKEKPQIIVGTPGRVLELIKKKKVAAHNVKTIIIDEADRLLDENNIEATKAVIKCTMKDRQLLFFSASMPNTALEQANQLGKTPIIIQTSSKTEIPSHIQHISFIAEQRDKLELLRKVIRIMKVKKAIIFINQVREIEEATEKLIYHHYKAQCLHGANLKKDRKRFVEEFRNGKINFLIATDIAARGLHFEGVEAVFHISIPENPIDYLHRAGRCGRNKKQGTNILIITKQEERLIRKYEKTFGISIYQKKIKEGKILSKIQ